MNQSDGVMFQDGQFNVASIDQEGVGSSYSDVWQHGVSNQAYSSQSGSETSTIQQGFTDDNATEGPAVSGDYANVSQSGGNDNSTRQPVGQQRHGVGLARQPERDLDDLARRLVQRGQRASIGLAQGPALSGAGLIFCQRRVA